MNEENYWEKFMASGRIEDYLTYVEFRERSDLRDTEPGETSYAGFLCSDGHGIKPDVCR